MAAVTAAFLSHRRWAVGALLALLLEACSAPDAPPRPILAEHCFTVSTALPVTLRLVTPDAGMLRIAVRQRGISLTAELSGAAANVATLSPLDRYGEMTFLANSRRAYPYTLRIHSRDSPDITGQACVATELIDPSEHIRLAAERAFADGGGATRARRWQAAFDDYLMAARQFDHVDHRRSAEARQAMASLAYHQLDRARDSYVLAQLAMGDYPADADPGMRSALLQLQATLVVESKASQPDTRREQALQLLDSASALAKRAPFGAREFPRLAVLHGFLEYATDHPLAAARFFAQAEEECKALHDWECYARARMNGASIAEETRNNTVALEGYADALRVLDAATTPGLAADIWDNLGRLQGYVGLFSLGEQSELNAIRLYAQIDNCDGVRRVLSTLGSIIVHVGNLDDGLVYLRLATMHDCGALLSDTRDSAQAGSRGLAASAAAILPIDLGANTPAEATCADLPPPNTLSVDAETSVFRSLLAINYASALETDAKVAKRCLAAAIPYASASRLQLRLANATGAAYLESAQPAQARATFLRALEVADRAGLAATHQNREVAYLGLARAAVLAHQNDEALRDSAQALLLGSARADVAQVVDALRILAMSLRAAGDRQRAQQSLDTAVNLIEQVPIDDLDADARATFLATQHGVFEELTDLLVEGALVGDKSDAAAGERTWAAFTAAERGRVRSLQYATSQATANDPSHAGAHSAAQYQELVSHIVAASAGAGTGTGWKATVEQLGNISTTGREPPAAVNAEQLLPQLERLETTLVEYAAGRDDMFAFVIDGADIHVVRLGSRKLINADAAELYERLHDPEVAAADVRRAARNLAELALWPLTRYVRRARLLFIADDSLQTVPFAVLPWSQDPDSALVVQHAESALAPSALFLMQHAEAQRARRAAPSFELIGDPIFRTADWQRECSERAVAPREPVGEQTRSISQSSESLPRLPGSRTEVLAIAGLARAAWPTSRIELNLGCRATPSALRLAAGADLLHIATHGYVDAQRPRLSALALTRESATDAASGAYGLLDILNAKSSARLVVLSACDTSRGRLLPGEGVLGPAQAFLQSGAAAVVASYWRIDDAATAAFMQTFYKYLLTARLPVATALRRTQLEHAANDSAHNWAGFAFFGRPDEVL
jgi:CHAT domain-containing protein